jgi:uncharacterized protein
MIRVKLMSPTAACLLFVLLAGCDDHSPTTGPQPQSGLVTVPMKLGSRDFTLEVADNDQSREIGLMYRDSMADDHGMIFVFPEASVQNFWMENTRIPLDIAFVDAGGTVVSVKSMLPLDRRLTCSDKPAKYAIEMSGGAAAAAGIKAGDHVEIPQQAANPATRGASTTN